MSNGLQPHVELVSAAQAVAARGLVLTAAQARDVGDNASMSTTPWTHRTAMRWS